MSFLRGEVLSLSFRHFLSSCLSLSLFTATRKSKPQNCVLLQREVGDRIGGFNACFNNTNRKWCALAPIKLNELQIFTRVAVVTRCDLGAVKIILTLKLSLCEVVEELPFFKLAVFFAAWLILLVVCLPFAPKLPQFGGKFDFC